MSKNWKPRQDLSLSIHTDQPHEGPVLAECSIIMQQFGLCIIIKQEPADLSTAHCLQVTTTVTSCVDYSSNDLVLDQIDTECILRLYGNKNSSHHIQVPGLFAELALVVQSIAVNMHTNDTAVGLKGSAHPSICVPAINELLYVYVDM